MRPRSMILSLLAALGLAAAARGDGLRVQVELEGKLAAKDGGFVLEVEGEEPWSVDVIGYDVKETRELVRARPNNKVRVSGTVQVRSAEALTLRLAERRVQKASVTPLVPGVRVTQTVPGSPAAAVVKVGDIILEVNSQEVSSFERLGALVTQFRGRTVPLAIYRDGDPVVARATLRTTGPALGVAGELVWVQGSQAMMMDPPPPQPPRPPGPRPQPPRR